MEYKVRKEESPEPVEAPKPVETPKPAKSRAPTPAARSAKPAEARRPEPEEPRPEPVVLKAAERTEGRRREETHDDADFGSSSDISVVRGRRNTTPSPRADTESEKEEVEVEPERVNRPDREDRPKRSEMTAEEKARDNYLSREAKRKRKAESAKAKGYTRRGGNVRVIQFDGWVQASGLEADNDPPELDDGPVGLPLISNQSMLTNGRVGPASLVASSSLGIVLCGLSRVLDQDAKGRCVKLWSSRSTSDGCVGTGKSAGIRADSGSRLIASSRRFSSSAISLEVLSLASYSFNLSHRISLEPQTGALSSFNRFFKSLTFEVGPRSTGLSAAPPAAGSSSSSALTSGGTAPG